MYPRRSSPYRAPAYREPPLDVDKLIQDRDSYKRAYQKAQAQVKEQEETINQLVMASSKLDKEFEELKRQFVELKKENDLLTKKQGSEQEQQFFHADSSHNWESIKMQAALEARSMYDSSIASSSMSDHNEQNPPSFVTPLQVQEQFVNVIDSVSQLQASVREQVASDVKLKSIGDSEQRLSSLYQSLVKSLFDVDLWKMKSLKKRMESMRLSPRAAAALWLEKDASNKNSASSMKQLLVNEVQVFIRNIIEKEVMTMKELLEKDINDCAEQVLCLTAFLVVSQPKMKVIVPKKGSEFNPIQHEDSTMDLRLVISSIKRPGLICATDNRVFSKALVETRQKKME